MAAASHPVGDVAFGDCELEFIECFDNFGVGDVVAEHAVDHVADGVGEAGDFAVAGAGSGWIIGLMWIDGSKRAGAWNFG